MMLFFLFFITAILYAAVGFGGGSTYNAILVLLDVDYRILPVVALICNLIVVSGGTYRFYRAGYLGFKRIWPWVVTSIPAAWIGGYIHISETIFVGVLGGCLCVAGIRMAFFDESIDNHPRKILPLHNFYFALIGCGLGFVSGMVGIGGGIFLAPILYILHWGNAKKIAAMCSAFILLNSLSGLIGQIMKLDNMNALNDAFGYWVLFSAVFIGGQIGSIVGVKYLNQKMIKRMTSILILYVSVRLIWRWWVMIV